MNTYHHYRKDYHGHNVPRSVRDEVKEMISYRASKKVTKPGKASFSAWVIINKLLPAITGMIMIGAFIYMIARELNALYG